jgi:hypothetical protein
MQGGKAKWCSVTHHHSVFKRNFKSMAAAWQFEKLGIDSFVTNILKC